MRSEPPEVSGGPGELFVAVRAFREIRGFREKPEPRKTLKSTKTARSLELRSGRHNRLESFALTSCGLPQKDVRASRSLQAGSLRSNGSLRSSRFDL